MGEVSNVVSRIEAVMARKGVTKLELAELLGWPPSKISKIFNGGQRISTDELIDIALALKTNPAILIATDINDIRDEHKEVLSLNEVFRKIAENRKDKEALIPLLEVELPDSMMRVTYAQDAGKTVDALYRAKRVFSRKDGSTSSPYVSTPRVIIEDNNVGQIFGSRLTIGYWFTDDFNTVYLAIHFANQGYSIASSKRATERNATADMRDFFRAIIHELSPSDYPESYEEFHNPRKAFDLGVVRCIRYSIYEMQYEEKLRNQLVEMYELYLKLIEMASIRISDTYTNLYVSKLSEYRKAQNLGIANANCTVTNLDAIVPVEAEPTTKELSRRLRSVAQAMERENYCCENDPNHTSFISGPQGKPFMEAHALIPLSVQDEFPGPKGLRAYSENIVCLCPTCHKMLEYGTNADKEALLMKLYLKHKDWLKDCGIEVSMMQLLKWYGLE